MTTVPDTMTTKIMKYCVGSQYISRVLSIKKTIQVVNTECQNQAIMAQLTNITTKSCTI